VAREAHSREDLLRDAQALSPRAEIQWGHGAGRSTAFVGFRGDSLSLYFGEDPVFHFNGQGHLRRAFVRDELIKAEHGRLAGLMRERSGSEVALVSRQLDANAQARFVADIERRLQDLRESLVAGSINVRGQVPPDGDALERLRQWLEAHPAVTIAASPRVS
jgi:hypothetical protein